MKKLLFKIFITISLCLSISLSVFAQTAYGFPAEDGGDRTLIVNMKNSDGEIISSGALSLFKVAGVNFDNHKFLYKVENNFADYKDEISGQDFGDYLLGMKNDFEFQQNAYFANSLMNYADEKYLLPFYTVSVDKDGKAVFEHLENGLYLVVQTEDSVGYYTMPPFLVSVPKSDVDEDGNIWYYYEIDAQPKTQVLKELPSPSPTPPDVPEIPNTGLPWMPIVIMAILGIILFSLGYVIHKKAETND